MIRVVNVKDFRDHPKPRPFIYVGRYCRSWGLAKHPLANPFVLPLHATYEDKIECLRQYRAWLAALPNREELLRELKAQVEKTGFPLACWCGCSDDGNLLCHAVVLAEEIEKLDTKGAI